LQEYYLHALSGPRPHAEDDSPDLEARRQTEDGRQKGLLRGASMSLTNLESLRQMPATMQAPLLLTHACMHVHLA
jgi:hypothetical protein